MLINSIMILVKKIKKTINKFYINKINLNKNKNI
ncbi:hypothetical protein SAMN05421682_12223 [Chryseobacterium indoltheticum]|uniref:Uncharacterized protein n=1 Tax=Chryseobacterium indoltheticum TaxID=254 RepID=A0ABY1K824_9FLAO|nr:hypothetical protein SAMN05421682_12223 [Chryseobacterium indoltheticum]